MYLISKIFRFKNRFNDKVLCRWFRLISCWKNHMNNGTIDWPKSAKASVPVRVDGVGHVAIGNEVMLGYRSGPRIGTGEIFLQARDSTAQISIGSNTITNNNISIVAMKSITIGESCQIGDMVAIIDCDFHEINPSTRNSSAGNIAPIAIGKNVWLGSRVMVLKGVTIGDNTIVAAGSIVTKSLPSNVIAAGVPAKVLKSI